jgi:hypothetical protein
VGSAGRGGSDPGGNQTVCLICHHSCCWSMDTPIGCSPLRKAAKASAVPTPTPKYFS